MLFALKDSVQMLLKLYVSYIDTVEMYTVRIYDQQCKVRQEETYTRDYLIIPNSFLVIIVVIKCNIRIFA